MPLDSENNQAGNHTIEEENKITTNRKNMKYSRSIQEHIQSIVREGDYFGLSNLDILDKLREAYPNEPPTMANITGARKRIKQEYNSKFEKLRGDNKTFIAAVMSKIRRVAHYNRELEEIKRKENQTDYTKMKVIEMQVALDNYELKLINDLPYMTTYHAEALKKIKDLQERLKNMSEDPNAFKTKKELEEDDFSAQKPHINVQHSGVHDKEKSTSDPSERERLEAITQNPELKNILKGRLESGLTPYFKKQTDVEVRS